MTKTAGAAAGAEMQAKVTGVKKLLAHFKKKLTNVKKQASLIWIDTYTYMVDAWLSSVLSLRSCSVFQLNNVFRWCCLRRKARTYILKSRRASDYRVLLLPSHSPPSHPSLWWEECYHQKYLRVSASVVCVLHPRRIVDIQRMGNPTQSTVAEKVSLSSVCAAFPPSNGLGG